MIEPMAEAEADQQLWSLQYSSNYPTTGNACTDQTTAVAELDEIVASSVCRNEVESV